MKHFKYIFIFALIIGITIAVIVLYQTNNPKQTVYRFAEVKRGSLAHAVSGLGKVKAFRESHITAELDGMIEKVMIKEGNDVSSGQLLLTISVRDLRETQINLSAKLVQLQSEVKQTEFELKTAQDEYQKNKTLYKSHSISGEMLDKSKNNLEQVQLQLESQNKAIGPIQELIALNNQKLANAYVKSNLSGKITLLPETIRPGSRLLSGQELAVISDTRVLLVEADFDEVAVRSISLNQEAVVRGYVLGETTLSGAVYHISPEVRDGKVRVQIKLDGSSLLRLGNTVEVEIVTDSKSDVLYVPIEALQSDSENKFIQVFQDGQGLKLPVKTGISTLKEIEIQPVSGNIQEGEQVILADPTR